MTSRDRLRAGGVTRAWRRLRHLIAFLVYICFGTFFSNLIRGVMPSMRYTNRQPLLLPLPYSVFVGKIILVLVLVDENNTRVMCVEVVVAASVAAVVTVQSVSMTNPTCGICSELDVALTSPAPRRHTSTTQTPCTSRFSTVV